MIPAIYYHAIYQIYDHSWDGELISVIQARYSYCAAVNIQYKPVEMWSTVEE